jgi:hypothetical protein
MGSKGVFLRMFVAASSAKTAGFACPFLYRNGALGQFELPIPRTMSDALSS